MRRVSAIGPAVERFFQGSLLGLMASGFLALASSGYLDPVTIAITFLALLLRSLLLAGIVEFEISGRAVMWMAAAGILFAFADFQFVSRELTAATARLILLLAAIKTVTANTDRDYAWLRIIALVELLTASVISFSLSFFVFLAFFLVFAIATFASSEMRRSAARGGVVVRTAEAGLSLRLGMLCAILTGGILVMTCSLFFLLPRTAALQHLISDRYHVAGFASEIHLGGAGEIEQRKTPVMSIAMEDGSVPPPFLKWKGGTLAEFDGHTWFNPHRVSEQVPSDKRAFFILAGAEQRRRNARIITYEVHLNGGTGNALFFAGDPEFLWLDAPMIVRTAPGSYRVYEGPSGGLIYQASSFLPEDTRAAGDDFGPILRQTCLQLPALDPRIPALAASVAAKETGDLRKARAIEAYLRRNYRYTLELPRTAPADPLADFLFGRRKGHCEYFASAMAVMLRSLGIPTRVATGFESGVYNPVSGRQIIRGSDAHSWVEAWFPERGWVSFDPTPPVQAEPVNWLFSRLSMYADAADVFWQDWVLDYNLSHQLTLAGRLEESSRRLRFSEPDFFSADWWNAWRDRCVAVARRYGFAGLSLLVAALMVLWFAPALVRSVKTRRQVRDIRHGRIAAGDATLLYERMLRTLRRRGIEKPVWLTPFEFAAMVQDPALALLVEDATRAYIRLRFGGETVAATRMIEALGEIDRFRSAAPARSGR